MAAPASINPRIIEALYCEALILSDEVRAAFAPSPESRVSTATEEEALALSCEGLRATTRMMQSAAWLLNHRAYLAGNLSELQLRRYGRLQPSPAGDPERLALLDPAMRELIRATELLHERLMRLEQCWRAEEVQEQDDIFSLQRRLGMRAHG